VGGEGILVRPGHAAGDVPGHQQQARVLQPLGTQPGGAGRLRPTRAHVPRRPIHGIRLEQKSFLMPNGPGCAVAAMLNTAGCCR
jgi:hypothetical protein